MANKQQTFINTIAPIAQAEYKRRGKEKAILPSVCIAQAALESGWNLKAKTVFGIKGKGTSLPTTEYDKNSGTYVHIVDSFKSYPDISSSVVGYYDFIANTPRYKNCLNNSDYVSVVYHLQHTTDGKSYATDPYYERKIKSIIQQYGLTKYDCEVVEPTGTKPTTKTIEDVAREIIRGWYMENGVKKSWGNGAERKTKLEQAGYSYSQVQGLVNKMLKG